MKFDEDLRGRDEDINRARKAMFEVRCSSRIPTDAQIELLEGIEVFGYEVGFEGVLSYGVPQPGWKVRDAHFTHGEALVGFDGVSDDDVVDAENLAEAIESDLEAADYEDGIGYAESWSGFWRLRMRKNHVTAAWIEIPVTVAEFPAPVFHGRNQQIAGERVGNAIRRRAEKPAWKPSKPSIAVIEIVVLPEDAKPIEVDRQPDVPSAVPHPMLVAELVVTEVHPVVFDRFMNLVWNREGRPSSWDEFVRRPEARGLNLDRIHAGLLRASQHAAK